VLLAMEERLGWQGAGWKVGAASNEVRRAENIPSPSPGLIYAHTIFESPAHIGPEAFINYRLCECEFAFRLGNDFPARDEEYTEDDVRTGIAELMPVIEIGDSVFEDWYSCPATSAGCTTTPAGPPW
jgi:2-keto-4-pentenoate hydratase